MIVKRVLSAYGAGGVRGVVGAIVRRIRTPTARCFPLCRQFVSGATGIEIGGPSSIFARYGMIPLYPAAKRVDNCNFARSTLWEGAIEEGHSFAFNSRSARGQQFIAEGVDLNMIPSDDYRFLLSSNMLEHTTNPLAALVEWKRLLEAGGGLILVLPHRDGTFDHRRPITTLDHLVLDFENSTPETNLDHLPEILALHDLARDPGAVDEATFRERAQRNGTVRGLHHHVFDTRLAMEVVSWAGFDLLAAEPLKPCQIVVVAQKPYGQASRTTLTASDVAEVLQKSPFASDRK